MNMRSRSENTKSAIVDAASELFMRDGYPSTSIDSIAESVGVTRKTVYNYFSNKGLILESVVDKAVAGGYELSQDTNIETIDDLNRELYLVIESANNILLSHKYIEFLRMAISEVKFQPDVRVMMKKGATVKFFKQVYGILTVAVDKRIVVIKNLDFSTRMFIGGFLVSLLIDGLLDPSHASLMMFSQVDAMEYVSVFLSNHSEGVIDIIK